MSAGPPGPPAAVTSLPGAIAQMQAIAAATAPGDGLACFNRMYLQVTQAVNSRLGQGFFADPGFMTALDVAFANLYFGAAAAADPVAVPPAAAPHLADYQKVDQLLDAAEQSVRQSFESAPELAADHHLQAVGNLVASWTINSAPDLASNNSHDRW